MAELHHKLKKMNGLLPSQRQWLERLIFQLEFNPYQLVHLVGGIGSGKSTLVLAVADLLSSDYNVALLKANANLTVSNIRQHLIESWFGFCKDANRSLKQLLGERQSPQPLAFVLDESEQLPAELWAELAEIPCLVIAASLQPDPHAELNLPLPALTLDDATLLLQEQQLSALTVADRLDHAQGNMHLLLDPRKVVVQPKPVVMTGKGSLVPPLMVFSTGMALIAAVVVFWLWSEQQVRPDGLGQLTYLPNEQVTVPTVDEPPKPHASRAVVEQLVEQLDEVKPNTGSTQVAGLQPRANFANSTPLTDTTAANAAMSSTPEPVELDSSTPAATASSADATPTVKVAANSANTQNRAEEDRTEVARSEVAGSEVDRTAVAVSSEPQAVVPEPKPTVLAAPTEDSLSQQMAAELALPAQQTVPATLPEPAEDLAAQAAAELARKRAMQQTQTAEPVQQIGGYKFSEADLLSMSGKNVALQLVVFSNDAAQQAFVRNHPQLQTYTYQRIKNGQRQLVVVLAPFSDAAAAKAQIPSLPAPLQQAFVKALSDIHSEISTQP